MLTVISPAKKLLNPSKSSSIVTTEPLFREKTLELVALMKTKGVDEIAALMDLSPDLARLNFERYQHFETQLSYPSVFLFQGDVYQGLAVTKWSDAEVHYAQDHLRILSGLYGVLKPLDAIKPYRLEMGVRLENSKGGTLYSFWQETLTNALNHELSQHRNPLLINLASTEYFKVINQKKLNYSVCTINFYENKNNEVKMIGIYSKKARGLMAQFIMRNQIDTLDGIKQFSESGYCFDSQSSSEHQFNFIRTH